MESPATHRAALRDNEKLVVCAKRVALMITALICNSGERERLIYPYIENISRQAPFSYWYNQQRSNKSFLVDISTNPKAKNIPKNVSGILISSSYDKGRGHQSRNGIPNKRTEEIKSGETSSPFLSVFFSRSWEKRRGEPMQTKSKTSNKQLVVCYEPWPRF